MNNIRYYIIFYHYLKTKSRSKLFKSLHRIPCHILILLSLLYIIGCKSEEPVPDEPVLEYRPTPEEQEIEHRAHCKNLCENYKLSLYDINLQCGNENARSSDWSHGEYERHKATVRACRERLNRIYDNKYDNCWHNCLNH